MAILIETLAEGRITTWAGTTRVVASAAGICAVHLPSWHGAPPPAENETPRSEIARGEDGPAAAHLRQALDELAEYFAGERRAFSVVLDLTGPAFFQQVWAEVARVPYGETRSYGEIARAVGAPEASRAVGAANGANPVAPFVPCHRIVGSDGRLTGYGPGLPLKQRLLVMEDALPASAADYDAWVARMRGRLGGALVLGLRATRHYCRPECARARASQRPNRVFARAEEARTAGFAPCPRCASDAPTLL
ncbi:MAG TPA: methylated-DNA--[protein]-cysteine S-methyltransferase [Ktedonobacterales bacterium]